MQVPLKISFHNMDSSAAIEARVRDRVTRLERFFDDIVGCRVTIEAPHKQHRSTVGITIDITVPGREIVVKREQRHHEVRDDAYQVIGVAFDTAERQLEDHARVARHDVKSHDGAPVYARVVRLYHDQDYGFIETADQSNLYFSRVVVESDGFDQLEVGSEVLYTLADDEGPMGPQASRVRLVRGTHPMR